MSFSEIRDSIADWLKGLGLSNMSGVVVSVAAAVVVTVLLLVVLRVKRIIVARITGRFDIWKETRIHAIQFQQQELLSAQEIATLLAGLLRVLSMLVTALLVFVYLTIVVALFPVTEHIAVAVVSYILEISRAAARTVLDYVPSLFQIGVILVVAFYLIRLASLVFNGIESERIKIRRFYPDWAEPTYKIVRFLLVALAAVAIIPLLPGASSPAFRGVSIFLGALVSLGSTGVVANIVAGTVSTYMRAFQAGDWVRIADTEGTVIKRTTFVTKIMTPKNVVVSVPNAMVLGNHIINYSELAKARGLILHTTVTIGYDVPWRQVHELLLGAARATERIEEDPEPFVRQTSLDDFYVSYQLNAFTSNPNKMPTIYSDLHANIQDAFNEAGVEIMSPHYSALRDGNRMAIPDDALPQDYKIPAIRVNPLEKIIPGLGESKDEA